MSGELQRRKFEREGAVTIAKFLILGGGFGGVVAAERLGQALGDEHQITLVSRSRQFIFYPALVRLAFGKCGPEDVSFDLRRTLLNRRVNFVEAEVARHADRARPPTILILGSLYLAGEVLRKNGQPPA